MAERVGPNNIG